MIFNGILSMNKLFFLILYAFFALFMLRHLFIQRKVLICLYHISIFCILFVFTLGGGGVQNDGYARLERFVELEKNNKLDDAKQNPQNYDSMLAMDIQSFKNSSEFKAYLKEHDNFVDQAEAVFIGWLFVILTDIAMMCVYFVRYGLMVIKNKIITVKNKL